ncbi:Sensor protein KdpD [Chromobacterium violaceum]|uniref:Sensor protein KdpD n=1 Tax=Chromobacterium violaceum TaxID=536 RepID=A0A447TA81_CHRVL|nr:Sensor protein KdpD [Chromobacterium violaceum]
METPRLQRLPEEQRARILKGLKLAQELGAETTVLGGSSLAATLLAYARTRNVSKLVVGKSNRGWAARLWEGSLVGELSRLSGDVDVYVVAHELEEEADQRASACPACCSAIASPATPPAATWPPPPSASRPPSSTTCWCPTSRCPT